MKNSFKDTKIGVWGFGVVGKSIVNYLIKKGAQLQVLDKKELSTEERLFLYENKIPVLNHDSLIPFLETNTFILPSPGIDLRPYNAFKDKWLSELDIFSSQWHKPLIAITGTIGKTSITELIASILKEHNWRVAIGGNIGIGMLDLLEHQENYDYAVLELSSYQLELCKHFSPDYALWTNFYPNHLDKHSSLAQYFLAKYKILAFQAHQQTTIIPLEILELLESYKITPTKPLVFFTPHLPTQHQLEKLKAEDSLVYFSRDNNIIEYKSRIHTTLLVSENIPDVSYHPNWLMIIALLDKLGISYNRLSSLNLAIPEHRGELVDTINGIEFYNDSKSTIFQSTQAAVERLGNKPLILFLGGQSKGIERSQLISQLKNKVNFIICFGIEAKELVQACHKSAIPASAHPTLAEAFSQALTHAQPGMRMLFSPAGSSFDLFKNYKDRGEAFISLVKEYKQGKSKLD